MQRSSEKKNLKKYIYIYIYVATVEALRQKERGDETYFTTKIGGKTSLGPSYFVL
jgi:hypothetical protein